MKKYDGETHFFINTGVCFYDFMFCYSLSSGLYSSCNLC